MIRVIATLEIAPGRLDDFLSEFRKIVPLVRAEVGCRDYQPLVDLPTTLAAQEPLRQDRVTVVEQWDDLESLERHLAAPHMLEYRKRVKDLVQRASLRVLEPVA